LLKLLTWILTVWVIHNTSASTIIGNITELQGSGQLTRDKGKLSTQLDGDVMFLDHLETANGRLKIQFIDDTKVSMTEHSEITIDEYYYDPNKTKSKMTLSFVSGTARFATGKLGLVPKENIVINTPTATIGIRGTDFTTTVDELGRSLVILLPDENCSFELCDPSGQITVTNSGGTVTLTEAYQATMVATVEQSPTRPVVIQDITAQLINNMFIVSPPEEVENVESEETIETSVLDYDFLSFSDLDYNPLDKNFLDDDALEFNELDIDFLDVDYLQDVLIVLQEVDYLKSEHLSTSVNIEGTTIGFDRETQYNTIVDETIGQVWFYRIVDGIISIRIPITSVATLDTTNEDRKNFITVNNGNSVYIRINQGSR